MYKRRKKVNPVASSTFLNENSSKAGSFTSSQSSFSQLSTISQNRSNSPDDIFCSSPPKSTSQLQLPIDCPSTSTSFSQKNTAKVVTKKTTLEVLNDLVSTDDIQPLAKVPKLNGSEPKGLSLNTKTGHLKFFSDVLSNAGFIIGRDGEPNYLKKSQAIFVRNLTRTLENDSKEQFYNTDRFIEDLEQYLSCTETLKVALSPTKNHSDAKLPGTTQECFVRLLLSVEVIQVKVVSFLLNKVAEYAFAGEEGDNDSLAVVRMILHSMRYLTKICDPESFTRKLFDIIHSVSSYMLKVEIINCLPDIINDTQREQTANELMELMKHEPHLSPAILVTLSNLWLDSESLSSIQLTLMKDLRKTAVDQLPAFVKFVTAGDITGHADEIINGLRSELVICHADHSTTQHKQNQSQADVSSTVFIIFEKLKESILKSKKLGDLWLKNIGKVKTAAYHKPIDILMLLILHSLPVKPDGPRKKAVEGIFRNKIKIGHFKESLVNDTLSVGLAIIKEYFSALLKLLSSLLQSQDLTVSSFSAYFYTECFVRLDSSWRKMIILELKDNVTFIKGNAKPALNLLHSLTSKHVSKVAPYVTLIMLLLNSVSEMKVVEVRQLMDILCIIAFAEFDSSSMDNASVQDELCMIVQKQLSKPDPGIFRSGIVSGVVIIKHMVKLKENVSNETPSSEEEEIVLSPMAKKALNLFELVLMGTRSSAEAQVLVFDQFSYIIMTTENMDKRFMKKISTLMQCQLQNHFIISSSDYSSKDNGLDSSLQYCIDTDFEDPIVLNLVDAVVQDNSQAQIPLVALPGLVRVIRGLELADLTEIDALLGCAISLPSPSIYSKFSSADPQTQRYALDCLFHSCNWWREMLNSFVYLIKDGSPEKIMKRLRALVHFQNLISVCLPQAYVYSPPKCYFEYSSGKQNAQSSKAIKIPTVRKRQKKNGKKDDKVEEKDEDESVAGNEADIDEDKEEELISLEFSKFKQHFRELDFDVCLILTQPLTLFPQPFKDGNCTAELGPSELMLILDDLNSKLRFCLGTTKGFPRKKDPVGFDNLSTVSLDLIIKNTSKLAHHLTSHMHKIVEYLHNLITVNDGILDATGMFTPGSHEIKQCLALIFSIFNTYMSWPDLESETYIKCLMKCLVKLAGPNFEKKEATSKNAAIKGSLNYLREITKCILDLTSAVGLINLMKTLVELQEDEDKDDINLGELCEDFLQRKWYDSKGAEAKGTLVNQQLTVLLDVYLSESDHSLENIVKVLNWLTLEVESLGENGLNTFPHFNKSNLNILIRSICKGLLTSLRQRLDGKDQKEQLEIWDHVVNSLQGLIAIIKIHDSRINLRQFLKGCLPILRCFLTHGMNVFSTMFKFESVLVAQTIKKLQVVTRYIQSICNYSKVNKDNSLIQQLPDMRGILEKIVLSVKNMVLQNKCTGAFFMGSMRNKDIHGEIISTQDSGDEMGDSEELQGVPENVTNAVTEASGNESNSDDDQSDGNSSDTY